MISYSVASSEFFGGNCFGNLYTIVFNQVANHRGAAQARLLATSDSAAALFASGMSEKSMKMVLTEREAMYSTEQIGTLCRGLGPGDHA